MNLCLNFILLVSVSSELLLSTVVISYVLFQILILFLFACFEQVHPAMGK